MVDKLLAGGIVFMIIAYAIGGAIGMGVTALIISGGLYLLGFIGEELAKQIFGGVIVFGAVMGAIAAVLQGIMIHLTTKDF